MMSYKTAQQSEICGALYYAVSVYVSVSPRRMAFLDIHVALVLFLSSAVSRTWNRSTGLHLFTMRHAHLLEIRKLQLAVKKTGS